MPGLDPQTLQTFLKKNPEWAYVGGRLERTFLFTNFARAMVFVNKIVNPIEEHQSYPRITITYNRVFVSLFNPVKGVLTEDELSIADEMEVLK